MSILTHLKARSSILATALLSLGLLIAPLSALPASAHQSGCRSDPHVYFTWNGATYKVDLGANIIDVSSDVTSAAFTLHLPAGAVVTSVVYTDTIPETLTTSSDNPAHQYNATVTVYTQTSPIPVTATMNVVLQTNKGTGSSAYNQDSGTNNQTLPVVVSL